MQISKEVLRNLFKAYVQSLPSKNPKKAVERIRKVEIFRIHQRKEEAFVIVGSPKQIKGPYGETLEGYSQHILKFNPEKRTISCSCPAYRKHHICKHVLKVLTILYLQKPSYLYRKLLFPAYKANRKNVN
jgi:hypothetical protein